MHREVVTQSFIYMMWDAILTVWADPCICGNVSTVSVIHGLLWPEKNLEN